MEFIDQTSAGHPHGADDAIAMIAHTLGIPDDFDLVRRHHKLTRARYWLCRVTIAGKRRTLTGATLADLVVEAGKIDLGVA